MRTIVCFGDSNTWAVDAGTFNRMELESCWPGVLGKNLGEGFNVIQEGLNGRTTVWDDPIEEYKNGKDQILPCIYSHTPDLVVILLGTNDLKHRFSLTAFDAAKGAGLLASMVMKSNAGPNWSAPRALLVAPPPLGKLAYFADMFRGASEKSVELGKHFAVAARECGCHFLDAGKFIRSSDLDGIHFDKSQHAILGREVANKVREIFAA
jgi:lysophospholipase L1-like esterase